jgi:hypothetical protein
LFLPGLFSCFLWSKGLKRFVQVLEPLNCSKGLIYNFGKWILGLLFHLQKVVVNLTELQTAFFVKMRVKMRVKVRVKMRESLRTRTFGQASN